MKKEEPATVLDHQSVVLSDASRFPPSLADELDCAAPFGEIWKLCFTQWYGLYGSKREGGGNYCEMLPELRRIILEITQTYTELNFNLIPLYKLHRQIASVKYEYSFRLVGPYLHLRMKKITMKLLGRVLSQRLFWTH